LLAKLARNIQGGAALTPLEPASRMVRQGDRQILKNNTNTIGSLNLEPMIRSMIPLVYVNQFPENKMVSPIYNTGTSLVQRTWWLL